jgi:lipoyl(octanoyl) transferase
VNTILNKDTTFTDLGLIDYQKAWDYQTALFESIVETKLQNRKLPIEGQEPTQNYLLFCEHPHVFTQGRTGNDENLLRTANELQELSASFYHINRGGDITYHGPGQIVAYPVIDLENFFTDIHRYMRTLEEAVIRTMAKFGVKGERINTLTGVWLDPGSKSPRKICALGVKTGRWVTMHGLAFNVNPDLSYFGHIVPCGIDDKSVTSMAKELKRTVNIHDVKDLLRQNIADLFEMNLKEEAISKALDDRSEMI